jgi:hypothetical protein
VLTEQDGTKWDWDLIAELFTTTLRSPKYLDEALRGGHFMKRLLGFFSPTSGLPELPMTLASIYLGDAYLDNHTFSRTICDIFVLVLIY